MLKSSGWEQALWEGEAGARHVRGLAPCSVHLTALRDPLQGSFPQDWLHKNACLHSALVAKLCITSILAVGSHYSDMAQDEPLPGFVSLFTLEDSWDITSSRKTSQLELVASGSHSSESPC